MAVDELQYITISGCNTTSATKRMVFKMVDSNYALQNISFNCDASAASLQSTILSATSLSVHVSQINSTLNGLLTAQVLDLLFLFFKFKIYFVIDMIINISVLIPFCIL